jgi:hypothetical protein
MLALVVRAEVDVHIGGPHSVISRHGLVGGMFIRVLLHFLITNAQHILVPFSTYVVYV